MTLREFAGLLCLKGFRAAFSASVVCLLFLALSQQVLLAESSITGIWKASQPRDDGNVEETYYRLKQNGAEIKGTIQFDWGDLAIGKGIMHGSEFHLEGIDPGAPDRPWKFDGVVEDGHLKVLITYPKAYNPNAMMAVRVSKGLEVPARIPLPALHKVPYNGLAKTPPMGWNSWNHFERRVVDATIRAIADAMATNGMRDAGYLYVNIDESWQGGRDANGNIRPNKKFPDMKAIADYVHSKGLKLGIYSSPGPTTCGNYTGSYGHEEQDAKTRVIA
jgi:alpha-galactosidase